MGKADALALTVLKSGTAKQIEYPGMVFRIDAAAVIDKIENKEAKLAAALDEDIARYAGLEILEGIINQIGEDLFQCEAITLDVRKLLKTNFCIGF